MKLHYMTDNFRFGFVALAGAPNVGKSTLLNRLIGHKISIVSRKPQTTRHRITGIRTTERGQIAFVDTPGLHTPGDKVLNKVIVKTALSSLTDVDLVLMLIDSRGWSADAEAVLQQITSHSTNIILVINKIDRMRDKGDLLPLIEQSNALYRFKEIIPVSALRDTGKQIDDLLETIRCYLPEGPAGFPEDQISDRSDSFLASELIREQTFSALGQELPYVTAVEIEKFKVNDKGVLCIDAVIWVEKDSQKSIVIGRGGKMLKMIGMNCRKQMELSIHDRVYLNLWVRVKKGWSDNMRHLNALGYSES